MYRNAANDETALTVIHAGTGKDFLSYQYGTGLAGRFQIDNPANNSPALHAVVTNGTGPAAFFEGNVGIGTLTTPTPSTALHVAGTVTATGFAGDGSGMTGLPVSPWNVSGTDVSYNAGDVRVGTAFPEERLHVAGGSDANGANGGFLLLGRYMAWHGAGSARQRALPRARFLRGTARPCGLKTPKPLCSARGRIGHRQGTFWSTGASPKPGQGPYCNA